MDIQLEKSNIIKMIEATDDMSVLTLIKNFFKSEKKDWWDELSEEQKADINIGLAQADAGEVVDFDDFISQYIK